MAGDRTWAAATVLCLLGPLAEGVPFHPPQADATPASAPSERLGDDLAAYAAGSELGFAELDEHLLVRFGMGQDGRTALRQLLELRVLEELALEHGIDLSDAAVNRRWAELDKEVRESGVADGLKEYMAQNEVDPQVFREHLRLALVQEVLTRRALGIPEGGPLTGEQQTMWLEGVIKGRGYSEEPPPWTDGVVARCGGVVLHSDELANQLRSVLPDDTLTESCYLLLLEKECRRRMPDVSDEALARAVETEIARRRETAKDNPEFQGVPYEELLGAQGLSIDAVRRDPAIRVAALAHLWVDRSHPADALQAAYESERAFFDGRFGEAVETRILLLNAARFKNDLNPRTFEEAEAELTKLREKIGGPEDFARLAREQSEDVQSRELGGNIGLVTRESPGIPTAIRKAVWSEVDEAGGDSAHGHVLGPLRIQGGCVLVCIGVLHRAPVWEDMAEHVHRELRRRFLEDTLPRGSVITWRDEA